MSAQLQQEHEERLEDEVEMGNSKAKANSRRYSPMTLKANFASATENFTFVDLASLAKWLDRKFTKGKLGFFSFSTFFDPLG